MNRLVAIVLGLLLVAGVCHGWAHAANKSGMEPQVLKLPEGPGSVTGLGESFEPDLNTGTAAYRIQFLLSPGTAGFEPDLAIEYNSGYGNGPAGLGWRLNVSFIQRQTDKKLPRYTSSDRFVYNGSKELVPLDDGFYRIKIEGEFIRFRRLENGWLAEGPDGTKYYYGQTTQARITTTRGIFRWYLERAVDNNGNTIHYSYLNDDGQPYLEKIWYGSTDQDRSQSVQLTYETRDDPVQDCRSGACVTTAQRLRTLDVLSGGHLVRRYRFRYDHAPGTMESLLRSVTQIGRDGVSSLPPVTFGYSLVNLQSAQSVSMENPPPVSIASPDADLIDLNSDSLPDLLLTTEAGHFFYMNEGNASWAENPEQPEVAPGYRLASDGVFLADMNGDGRSDLVVQSGATFGYFRNDGHPWEKETDWIEYNQSIFFSLESPDSRLADLSGDALADVLYSDSHSLTLYLNDPAEPWVESFTNPNPTGVTFSNHRLRLADMNGDGLDDLVWLHSSQGGTYYLPGMGYGKFSDREQFLSGSPVVSDDHISNGTVLLFDVNHDGYADLVLVYDAEIQVYLNRGNDAFSAAITISGTPRFSGTVPALRAADMNGDGCRDLLYSPVNAPVDERYRYVDFCRSVQPNLLTRIDNGIGRTINISYRPSTSYFLEARDQGNPWAADMRLPMAVQVVSRREIHDQVTGQTSVTEYTYRDGYYDPREREFRGFAEVLQKEVGDEGAPTLWTRFVFDVGKDEESRKGMTRRVTTFQADPTVPSSNAPIFQDSNFQLTTRQLAVGTDGEKVRYTFTSREDNLVYEGETTPVEIRTDFDYDEYGNEIKEFNYGIVEGADLATGNDELLTTSRYGHWVSEDRWMVDRLLESDSTLLDGSFVSATRNSYDERGNLIRREESPEGTTWIPVVRNTYDAYGNIVKMVDANGHSRSIGYDDPFHCLPVSETLDDLNLAMSVAYDLGWGRALSFSDFNGQTTRFSYDTFGRLIAIVKPGDNETYPTRSFQYHLNESADGLNWIIEKKREVSGESHTLDQVTYLDGLGRKIQVRTEAAREGRWVISNTVQFNARGKPAKTWLPYYDDSLGFRAAPSGAPFEATFYDSLLRRLKQVHPDGSFTKTLYHPLQEEFWDEEDNNPLGPHAGTPRTICYDGLERTVKVLERNGTETYSATYAYDGLDNVVKIVDNLGNIQHRRYDGLGRMVYVKDPDKGEIHYRYDDAGNLVERADSKAQVVTYTYDPANRLVTVNHDGVRVYFHYDTDLPADRPDLKFTLGHPSYIEDEAGRVAFSYDARGRLAYKVRWVGGYEFLLGYEYDAMDRPVDTIYPDGFKVTYRYNPMGLLESIPGFVEEIQYQPSGQKLSFAYSNGLVSRYEYDPRQRLIHMRTNSAERTVQDLTYDYDHSDNITKITDLRAHPPLESLTREFEYDDLYQLTRCSAASWQITYAYDSIGNLVKKISDVSDPRVNLGTLSYGEGTAGPHAVTRAGSYTYSYDANGNIKTKTGYHFTFDYNDRLISLERQRDGLRADYRYDYAGNRMIKSVSVDGHAEQTLYIDNLVEVRSGHILEYVYAGNRRVAQVCKPFDPHALLHRPVVLDQSDFDSNADGTISGDEIKAQGDDPDSFELYETRDALRLFRKLSATDPDVLPFSVMAAAVDQLAVPPVSGKVETVFYVPDHLGSVSLVTDRYGKVVEEAIYYPYGMDRARQGSYVSPYRFTGKELDEESDLHYFGARYYDAMVGRFVSVDPLAMAESVHSLSNPTKSNDYAYSNNNPMKYIDISGLFSLRTYWLDFLHSLFGKGNSQTKRPEKEPADRSAITPTSHSKDTNLSSSLPSFDDSITRNRSDILNRSYRSYSPPFRYSAPPVVSYSFPVLGKPHPFIPGNCTWYVAQSYFIPWGGNAGTWLDHAENYGYRVVRNRKKPREGAIVVTDESPYGHVAIITEVSENSIAIREMNYRGLFKESTRKLKYINNSHIKGYIYGVESYK